MLWGIWIHERTKAGSGSGFDNALAYLILDGLIAPSGGHVLRHCSGSIGGLEGCFQELWKLEMEGGLRVWRIVT